MENDLKKICIHILVFSYIFLISIQSHAADTESEDERLFKAAFTYNFAKFTIWPENTPGQDGPLILCTIGNSKLVNDLNRLGGKFIKGRSVIIKPVKIKQSKENCHILYIAKSEINKVEKILKPIKNKPVLTVSDLSNFVKTGGIIQFYRKNRKTHLIINLNTARQSGLEISSRLLILAEVINTEDAP